MKPALRPLVLLAAPLLGAGLVAIAWQGASVADSRPSVVVRTQVQTRVETHLVPDTAGIQQLTQQVAALQQAVTATSQDLTGQLAGLRSSVAGMQRTVATLQQDVGSAQSATASQGKQVSALSGTLTTVNQQLQALQAQFIAELRKLESSPAPPAH